METDMGVKRAAEVLIAAIKSASLLPAGSRRKNLRLAAFIGSRKESLKTRRCQPSLANSLAEVKHG